MPRATKSGRTLGVISLSLLVLIQASIWGLGNPLTKIAYAYTSPFTLLAIRFSIASVLFLLLFSRRIARTIRSLRMLHVLIVGLTTAFAFIFAYLALSLTDATTAGFLMTISIVFMPLFSRLVEGSPVDKKLIPITVIVLVGMYLLCGGGKFYFGMGELLAVLSSVAFAFSLAFSSRYLEFTDPILMTFSQCFVTALLAWILALSFEPIPNFGNVGLNGIVIFFALGIGCSFSCYIIQNFALARLPSTLTALILTTESVFSALFAFLLLKEQMSAAGYWGACLIIIGVILATLIANRKEHVPTIPDANPPKN